MMRAVVPGSGVFRDAGIPADRSGSAVPSGPPVPHGRPSSGPRCGASGGPPCRRTRVASWRTCNAVRFKMRAMQRRSTWQS